MDNNKAQIQQQISELMTETPFYWADEAANVEQSSRRIHDSNGGPCVLTPPS